jgi:hypothetical protein
MPRSFNPGVTRDDALTLMRKIDRLAEDQQKHLQQVIQLLLETYSENADEANANIPSGVLLVRSPNKENTVVLSFNANEFDVAEILNEANEAHNTYIASDAPAKEMFN